MKRDMLEIRPEKGRRIIAVSDIHGNREHFDALLEKVGFCREDLLVVIGDIIDCGPDSLGALRHVMELVNEGRCIALSGNWEGFMGGWLKDGNDDEALKERCLKLMDDYGACLLSQMCAELGFDFDRNTDMARVMPEVRMKFAAEIEFMANLPVTLDTGDFFFVHGGVPTLDKKILAELDHYGFMKNDHFAENDVKFDRWVIVGHWPVSLYDAGAPDSAPHLNHEKKIASIDGGMGKKFYAQLNALIMHAGKPGEFTWEYFDTFPLVRALEGQAASENPVQLGWNNRRVEIISRGENSARVKCISTGQEMDIPSAILWNDGTGDCASDATDNMLGIEPGEIFSAVYETDAGIFGKKDSITGWYRGKYEKKL